MSNLYLAGVVLLLWGLAFSAWICWYVDTCRIARAVFSRMAAPKLVLGGMTVGTLLILIDQLPRIM